MMPMILTVFLSNNEQILTEVPITPETTCRDVVEFCKEPGEGSCHLAEVWRGNERHIPFDHMMYDHLQKWGPRREEVKFFLRHEESPAESNEQSGRQTQNQRNGINIPVEKRTENGVGNPRVELTLSELQDMAARQQQQIENQQQMLVAKEQRLRYLKQQERRQQQSISESEKLQKLKERVETQESKLKKIRAMRGQVDYSKIMNGNLSTEIEHISAMFQEKQQELQAAVLKVDQLTQQLEDLRKGKLNGFQSYNGQMTGPAAVELKKLYQELQIRNRLNQEQNSKLQQQKELLNKRNMEVAMMDKRINELRERLYKKKVEARQKENIPLNRINGTSSPQSSLTASGRVAAVGPYIQVPSAGSYAVPVDPVKPQSLTIASTATHGRSKSETDYGCVKKSPGTWKISDLDIIVDPILSPPTSSLQSAVQSVICLAPTLSDTLHYDGNKNKVHSLWTVSDLDVGPDYSTSWHSANSEKQFLDSNDGNWPTLKQSSTPVVKPPQISNADWKESSMDTALKQGTVSSQPLPSSVLGSTDKLTKRTNLKKPNSERTGHGLRVKFNPLALLLDASLEGEFDLVQRIIYEVDDPSKPNDEGITPLHNAVCAGHHHIVKFLLDFGVNVNAADSDGWTPLHCAASCNSVHLCKLLVESGAAIFASTISDIETAADKCEEMEEGYIQCSQFLYGVQEKLGVMNKGVVYALWDYEAQNNDELSFHEGDAITILRRKDDNETEWWWARLNDKEGYVPKNLLGLYPRIKPRQRTLA
ncbi:apoptosis-stimulating of p53 protein 1 isoform X34 [Chrysemys picta bellii]|uniref:apoptosis-stimulating of p53 protein 1 isoform X34 n=1 Tax=Chrysemys picta bellii TaxID=8478 RepID=UPI0032B13620